MLRDGFKERVWRRETLLFPVDVPPSGWVQAPLHMLVSTEVEPAKYGGVSLYASAEIWSSRVAELIKQLPPGCFDEVTERAIIGKRDLPRLASVVFDTLTSSDWTTIEEAALDVESATFFRVVDGPLRQWADERSTPERLLTVQAQPGARETQVADLVRNMAVLAAQENLTDVARGLVADYVPAGRADTVERLAWFERELAQRLPAYGRPARS